MKKNRKTKQSGFKIYSEPEIANLIAIATEYYRKGNLDKAKVIYLKLHNAQPDNPDFLFYLGIIENKLGKTDLAVKFLFRVVELIPDYVEAYINLGIIFESQGKLEDVISFYKKVLTIKPDYAQVYNELGLVLTALKKADEAILIFKQAIKLEPAWPQLYYNLAIAQKVQNNLVGAILNYRIAIDLKPDYIEAYNNLGLAYLRIKEINKAISCFEEILNIQPDNIKAYNTLGNIMFEQKMFDEAGCYYKKAITIKPDYAQAVFNLGEVLIKQSMLADALPILNHGLSLQPDLYKRYKGLLLQMLYYTDLTQGIWKQALYPIVQLCSVIPRITVHSNRPAPEKRLRIGYVSPDFWEHSCIWFIEPLLASHNKLEIEIVCYSLVDKSDIFTDRIKELADIWHNTSGLTDLEMVELIQKDQIDILVDLAGYTNNNRLEVFSYKAAPIQVAWLGFPGTTGIDTIDYRLSDLWLTPLETTEYFSEILWNLERPVHCYRPAQDTPLVEDLPYLNNGYITFGSFNKLDKITPETLGLWTDVLKSVPNSHLLLKTDIDRIPVIKTQLLEKFCNNGIDISRIEISGKIQTINAHLNFYNKVDICLDTYPYNGATTTLEAMFMGVPVISLVGDRTSSRYGLSFLTAVNLPELAVNTTEQFVEAASELASNTKHLAELRSGMREKLLNSPICDESGFANDIEMAFRLMWRKWCNYQDVKK